jgi:hypothetical protein
LAQRKPDHDFPLRIRVPQFGPVMLHRDGAAG